jgi:acyl dehydratase
VGVRFYEDFEVGATFPLGERAVTREEMLAFARDFDPQPFHVDEEAARRTHFGGLVASGLHAAAIQMRMFVDRILNHSACMGSPGVEEIRFPNPLRPGDTVRGTLRVLSAVPSDMHEDRGMVLLQSELRNQHGQVVLRLRSHVLFARRPA